MATVTKPPDKKLLLKGQRNQFFETIQEHGLTPSHFSWDEASRGTGSSRYLISSLRYTGTDYHFDSDPSGDGGWYWTCAPGNNEPDSEGDGEWSDLVEAFGSWLDAAENEASAPDLWSGEILAGIEVEPGDESNNSPLTDSEVRVVEKQIAAVRAYLLQSGIAPEQLKEANRKLDYLTAAAKRVGRFDWRNLAVGIVVDIAINAAFNPQQAQTLLNLMVGAARHLIGS